LGSGNFRGDGDGTAAADLVVTDDCRVGHVGTVYRALISDEHHVKREERSASGTILILD